MNQFWSVFQYSYSDRVKSKVFIITTLILLIIEGVILYSPNFITKFNHVKSEKVIVLIDEKNSLNLNAKTLNNTFKEYNWEVGSLNKKKKFIKKVQEKSINTLFTIEKSTKKPEINYYSLAENQSLMNAFSSYINLNLSNQVAKAKNLDSKILTELLGKAPFESHILNQSKGSTQVIYAMMICMYIAILTYGQAVATSIATEKSNRVMEIVITKVKPTTIMFGKIFGIGFASLTQFGIAIIGFIMMGKYLVNENSQIYNYFTLTNQINLEQVIYFLVFFTLGYFIYASLFAIAGAVVSRTEDLTGVATPISIIMIVSYIISAQTISSPNTIIAKVVSYIPFSSPIGMFIRVSTNDIPFYEVAISIGILILTIACFAFWAAKVYPKNIMNYNQSFKFNKLIKQKKISHTTNV